MKTETEIRKKLYKIRGYRNFALKTGKETYIAWCKVVKVLEWILDDKEILEKKVK